MSETSPVREEMRLEGQSEGGQTTLPSHIKCQNIRYEGEDATSPYQIAVRWATSPYQTAVPWVQI